MYLATINVPGYLPMDDDPPTFETAREAWQYLADERDNGLDSAEVEPDDNDVWHYLVAQADDPGETPTGTAYGTTPGYDGDHDLGLAYSVEWISEAHEWHRAPFTGAVTCERCGLLPLDEDDTASVCPGRRDA